jgi:hypothetical protein
MLTCKVGARCSSSVITVLRPMGSSAARQAVAGIRAQCHQ